MIRFFGVVVLILASMLWGLLACWTAWRGVEAVADVCFAPACFAFAVSAMTAGVSIVCAYAARQTLR